MTHLDIDLGDKYDITGEITDEQLGDDPYDLPIVVVDLIPTRDELITAELIKDMARERIRNNLKRLETPL